MVSIIHREGELHRLFSALTEHTFQVELGIADPPLVDYLAGLLARFIRMDAIFRIRDVVGKRLDQVAEMLMEAEQRTARPQREIYRHIGDFTLYWTGVFPEVLQRLRGPDRKDHLLSYPEQGKRSYYLASKFEDEEYRQEVPVLRRLSEEYDLCTFGLSRVRQEWEKLELQTPEGGVESN